MPIPDNTLEADNTLEPDNTKTTDDLNGQSVFSGCISTISRVEYLSRIFLSNIPREYT